MDINDIQKRLLYDKDKFDIYLDYRNKLDNNSFLSFEEFLLCANNLERYIASPEEVYDDYVNYHENEEIKDFECFTIFCKTYHVSPYDSKVLDEYRACKNCVYHIPTKNLLNDDEYYSCRGEFIPYEEDVCEYHSFNPNKADNLIRILRK